MRADHFVFKKRCYHLVRIGLGSVFVFSGMVKAFDLDSFSAVIQAFAVLPLEWCSPAAAGICFLELIFGAGLVLDIKAGLAGIFGLLVLFIIVLGHAVIMGYDIDCGCFGANDPETKAFSSLKISIARDIFMIFLVVYLYVWRFKNNHRHHSFTQIIKRSKLKMKSTQSILFIALMFLVVLCSAFSAHASLLGPDKFEQEVEKEKAGVKLVREVQRGGYDVVTAAELNTWIQEKKSMVIVDTMPYEDSFKKNHIPGAVQFLFPIPEMAKWDTSQTAGKTMEDFQALLGGDKDKVIVIYCGFVKCTRSHNGAAWAKKLGYKNVYRFSGGIFAWKGAKYAVDTED